MERIGRRPLLIGGAAGMAICQIIIAVIGVTVGFNKTHTTAAGETLADNTAAVNAQIAFIAIYICMLSDLSDFCSCTNNISQSSSPAHGVPAPGLSLVKSSLCPSVPVVSLSPPPPTGSGTPSSPSSHPTW